VPGTAQRPVPSRMVLTFWMSCSISALLSRDSSPCPVRQFTSFSRSFLSRVPSSSKSLGRGKSRFSRATATQSHKHPCSARRGPGRPGDRVGSTPRPSLHVTAPSQQLPQGAPKAAVPVGAPRARPALANKASSLPTPPRRGDPRARHPPPSLTKDAEGVVRFDVRGRGVAEDAHHVEEVFEGQAVVPVLRGGEHPADAVPEGVCLPTQGGLRAGWAAPGRLPPGRQRDPPRRGRDVEAVCWLPGVAAGAAIGGRARHGGGQRALPGPGERQGPRARPGAVPAAPAASGPGSRGRGPSRRCPAAPWAAAR